MRNADTFSPAFATFWREIDVDRDRDANEQVKQNGGSRITPAVLLPEGNVVTGNVRMAASSEAELLDRLRAVGLAD